MMTKDVTINIETGLEARPVAQLVQVASQFDSKIYLEVEDKKVNELLKKLYDYLDSKIFKYIDTDRDIIDIQTYVKLTYENKL